MRLDTAAWASIRQAFETGESKVRIAARFGISVTTLNRRAALEGWSWPKASRAQASAAMAAKTGIEQAIERSARPRAAESPEARLKRMLSLIDVQLDKLERRMTAGDGTTAQDDERDIRTLNATIGCLEKVTEVSAELTKTRAAAAGGSADGTRETERIRREIAERLERLNAQWLAHEKPR